MLRVRNTPFHDESVPTVPTKIPLQSSDANAIQLGMQIFHADVCGYLSKVRGQAFGESSKEKSASS